MKRVERILILAAFLLCFCACAGGGNPKEEPSASSRHRCAVLDRYAAKMLVAPEDEWVEIRKLPRDMVLYRYVDGKLQCWNHQFHIVGENLSPLNISSESWKYQTMGTGAYLIRKVSSGKVTVVEGLQIQEGHIRGGRLRHKLAARQFRFFTGAERKRLSRWAEWLVKDRDVELERQLVKAENLIAQDIFISSLSVLDNVAPTIARRICEYYLPDIPKGYDVRVSLNSNASFNPDGAVSIAPGSRFLFTPQQDGRPGYSALYFFFDKNNGTSRMLVTITANGSVEWDGAVGLNNESNSMVNVPSRYSYARYFNGALKSFNGKYAYPTTMPKTSRQWYIRNGYIHFANRFDDGQVVIISRPTLSPVYYVSAGILVLALIYLAVLFSGRKKKSKLFERNHYQSRISTILMAAVSITLVVMTAVSVTFLYVSNRRNMTAVMTDRITSIQKSFYRGLRDGESPASLTSRLGRDMGSVITLYAPDGRLLHSTAPDYLRQSVVSSRIDSDAYARIVNDHLRYYIHEEFSVYRSYFCMYVPVIDAGGTIRYILSSQYPVDAYNFESDSILWSMVILSIFIILLFLSKLISSATLQKLFKPLSELYSKMRDVNIDNPQYIDYDSDDEVSTLVGAYNRMVDNIQKSTRELASAERDKAWSGMARQVAHEIKNPLTPMRLKLQRLVRLKSNGDPAWKEQFDETAAVILDHIDILTHTADEFSSFAKLYSEEPVSINLDKLLREEVEMFTSENICSIEYVGLSDAVVSAPKPQLTRVFINLINNAVQAVSPENGRVRVSLRNGSDDGFYEIVIEDNGDGVSEDNIPKLFTPNFTTKTGGTGLGLAISKSILQKCEATISYSRSFALGGAAFTVLYPKGEAISKL